MARPRRTRSDIEIERQARLFRALRAQAEPEAPWPGPIAVWLEEHVPLLDRLLGERRDPWRLDDLGRALAAAGVAYATGVWRPRVLAQRLCEARRRRRAGDSTTTPAAHTAALGRGRGERGAMPGPGPTVIIATQQVRQDTTEAASPETEESRRRVQEATRGLWGRRG